MQQRHVIMPFRRCSFMPKRLITSEIAKKIVRSNYCWPSLVLLVHSQVLCFRPQDFDREKTCWLHHKTHRWTGRPGRPKQDESNRQLPIAAQHGSVMLNAIHHEDRTLITPFLEMLEPTLMLASKYQPEFVQAGAAHIAWRLFDVVWCSRSTWFST